MNKDLDFFLSCEDFAVKAVCHPACGHQVANTVQAAHPDKPRPDVTKLAQLRTDVAVIPTATGNQLVVPYQTL